MPDDQRILTGEVLPPLDKVETSIGPATFDNGLRIKHVHDAGGTIHDLLLENLNGPYDTQGMVVELVRGHARVVVPHDRWHLVKPKSGTQVLVSIVPQGSPKKILRSVLLIAVAVAAFYTGGLVAGAVLPGAASTSFGFLLVQGLTAAAITAVGALAINALLPIKPPKLQNEEARTSAGSINNRLQPGAVVPVVLGDMRMHPPHAAAPYTENVGEDRYQVALLCCGHGPVKISDLRIGTIPIDDYEDVTLDIREGWPDDPAIGIYKNEVTSDQHGTLLEPSVWKEFTTQANTDEASIDFVFEQGLIRIDEKGKRHTRSVSVEVQYREVGTSTWQTASTYQNVGSGNINIPNINWGGYNPASHAAFEDGVVLQGHASFTFSAKAQVPRAFTKSVHFPQRGHYEIRFRRTTAAAPEDGDETVADEVKLAIIRSIKHEPPVRGLANQKNLAFIAVKMRLTDQKAGSIQNLNCRVQRYYPIWTGTSWVEPETVYAASGDLTPHLSRSPAAAFCYVARGAAGKRTIADNRLHMETIVPWWTACDAVDSRTGEARFTYDRVIEQPSTLKAMLQEIAHVGRARLDGPDGRTGIVRDETQTDPKGIFTPRNTRGFKGSFSLGEEVHGARVTFANEDNHYQEDTIVAYADGWNEETATKFIDLTHPGCTRTAQAHVYGRDQLLVLKHRPEVMEFDASIDAMHNRIGDYVVVHTNQAVPVQVGGDVQEGAAARIKAIYENGSNQITSVELDATIPVKAGVDYSLIIRRPRKASFTVTAEVQGFGADTETNSFTFQTPLTDIQAIDEGCLVVLGETNRVARDCIISGIRPGPIGPDGAMEFKVKVLDLAPEIQNSQTEALPVFPVPAGFTQDPVPERVDNLTLTETLIYDGGIGRLAITARWEPDNTGVATHHVEIYELDGSSYIKLGESTGSYFNLPHTFTKGETLEIAVVAVSATGAKRPTYLARRASLVIEKEASTAWDIADLIGEGRGGVIQDPWINRYDATGQKGWKHTGGIDYITGFVRSDGNVRNGFHVKPGTGHAYEYRNGKAHRNNLLPGKRIWNERFDTSHKEQVYVTFYGEKRNNANGKITVAIIFYDARGKFIKESRDQDTIDFDEAVGSVTRRFVAPARAVTGEVHAIFQGHTAGDWYITGSKGTAYAPADQGSSLDNRDAPTEPDATKGARVGVNTYDSDGRVLEGQDLITADGQMVIGHGFDFNGTLQGWTGNDVTLTAQPNALRILTTGGDARLYSPQMNVNGSDYTHLLVRMRRVGGDPQGTNFEWMQVFWGTENHGIDGNYKINTNRRLTGKFQTFALDMREPRAGGDDWISSTIKEIRLDPTITVGDTLEIDWIGFGRIASGAEQLISGNLADEMGLVDIPLDAVAGELNIGSQKLSDMNVPPLMKVSHSLEVVADGTRQGRLVVKYIADDDSTELGVAYSPFAQATGQYETVSITGETIPANCHRIRWYLDRGSAGSGQVACRRVMMNQGDRPQRWARVRGDVAQGADVTDYDDERVSNASQTLEALGAGQLAYLEEAAAEHLASHSANHLYQKDLTLTPATIYSDKLVMGDYYHNIEIPGKTLDDPRARYFGYIRDYASAGGAVTLRIYRANTIISGGAPLTSAGADAHPDIIKLHEGPLTYTTAWTYFTVEFHSPSPPAGQTELLWYLEPIGGSASHEITMKSHYWQAVS